MPNWEIYLAVTVPCTPECSEALASFLFDLDATGVVENNGSLTASFKGVRHEVLSPIRNFVAALQSMGHPVQPEAVFSEEIENRDWNAEWKKGYTGFKISARIYIKPTWEAPPARPYPCLIAIDPEMAFGTGTHATTRLCLRMLDHHLQPGARVLDIGTGTGILAIAAARLGAGAIVAFDVDPVAAETARRNAAANGVHTGLEIFAGELADLPPLPFDLVLATSSATSSSGCCRYCGSVSPPGRISSFPGSCARKKRFSAMPSPRTILPASRCNTMKSGSGAWRADRPRVPHLFFLSLQNEKRDLAQLFYGVGGVTLRPFNRADADYLPPLFYLREMERLVCRVIAVRPEQDDGWDH